MARSKNKAKVVSKQRALPTLPRAEWDFRPIKDEELVGCFMWEYLRETSCDSKSGQQLRSLVLLWTYDVWDDRQKLNTRYKNLPKSIIVSASKELGKTPPPWQEIDVATRKSYVSSMPRRAALIPVRRSRQSLYEWTYTFIPEAGAIDFYDWAEGIQDLSKNLADAVPEKPGAGIQEFRRWISGAKAATDALAQIIAKRKSFDLIEATETRAEPPEELEDPIGDGTNAHPDRSGFPRDLIAAKHRDLVSQPDFLINWQEYDKAEIKNAFEIWLDETESKRGKPRVHNSESRAASLRKDLQGLGILRLLHAYTLPDLVATFPVDFGRYKDPSTHKGLYKLRKHAVNRFIKYVALRSDELPSSATTKSGRSPLGF